MSNKFPQLEWITVDGRPTPVPKVQHYKKGSTTETELTGHDNPFPVANYTQNNNGLWLPVSMDNPVPTQLTGSNVAQGTVHSAELLLPRKTRSSGVEINNITVPAGVSSALIYLTVFGATGNFEGTNSGASIEYRPMRSPLSNRPPIQVRSDYTSHPNSTQLLAIGAGFEAQDAKDMYLDGYGFKVIGMPVGARFGFYLSIRGEFEEGQGIDCQVEVAWLY